MFPVVAPPPILRVPVIAGEASPGFSLSFYGSIFLYGEGGLKLLAGAILLPNSGIGLYPSFVLYPFICVGFILIIICPLELPPPIFLMELSIFIGELFSGLS
jgi:hypothetical protein